MVESTAKLRSEILALTGVDIMDGANQFKSTYAIMDELAAKWQDLTDIQQATVTELIAGKRQGNIVSSLMTNFDTAREALETSMNSAGSAMAEHEKWQQSLEARINSLKASWQALSQAFLSSDFLKGAIDAVIKLVDALDWLMDKVGTLPTLIGIFAGGLSAFKNKGFLTFDKDAKSMQLFGNALTNLKGNLGKVSTAIGTYNSNLSKSKGLQNAYVNALSRQNSGLGKYLSNLNGAKASFGGYITSLVGATIKTIALEAATIALNAAITMGISFAISALVKWLDEAIETKAELAERVEELTSKFKEQSNELKKLKGDYDTTNESSMISRYEKLSKGVDNLGRNVSLTSDEYSEYQSIVNQIADQIPSLVSGYDSQGNALLSCKDNVEELTTAYEKLIHAQNTEILSNAGAIEENFANAIEKQSGDGWWSNNHGFWAGLDIFKVRNMAGDYDLKSDTVQNLERLLKAKDKDERDSIYAKLTADDYSIAEIRTALEKAGIEKQWGESNLDALERALKEEPAKIKGIIDNYYAQFAEAVEQSKTIATAKLSEAFDISNAVSGLNYGNISEDLQAVAYQVVNSLDWKFFEKLKEDGMSVEDWTTNMLDQLNSIGKDNNDKISAAFDLQTQFNGGEISYGEYVKGLKDANNLINRLDLDKEVKSQLKLSLGLNEKGLVEDYEALTNKLGQELYKADPTQGLINAGKEAQKWLNDLTAEEYSVAVDIIAEMTDDDFANTIDDFEIALKKEMMLRGLTFDLNLEVESAGLEALNKALTESVSATGLSSESIAALKGRYADLEGQGYDLSSMFEETSTGIRINREEFAKLEKVYGTQKLADIDSDLAEMKLAYDDLGEAIKNCDDPIKKSELFNDRQTLAQRISEAATLASQYQGLTSAYNDWLTAESAGQERDMYENVIKGFETVDDEISRGWIDDGAIEFLELLTGRTDLAGKSGKQLKEIYDGLDSAIKNTTYSVRDFFTVDEDGNSTNAGVYNFLDAIGQLEEEKFGGKDVVKRDKDGNVIGFDFELAGGDEVIAEALGVSEELVQIMVRAADDAGFVVSMDGTYRQLADLQNEAKAAADYLHQIGKTDFEFDLNTSSVENLKDQLTEAHKILDSKEFWNKDGTFNFNADGATQAMQIVSTLQAKLDKLTEEQYGIGLTVEDEEFEEPLENLQDYGHKVATLNQLELNPKANAEEIDKINGELVEIAKTFDELDDKKKVEIGLEIEKGVALTQENLDKLTDEKKIKLGFVDEEGNPLTEVTDVIRNKIESGEVKIPTVLDIQANMDKNIETLADLALLNSGLLSESQEETIRKKYNVEVEADEVDTSDVEEKTNNALRSSRSGKFGDPITREANIEVIAETLGIEDVDDLTSKLNKLSDKTIEAVAEVIGRIDVEKLQQTMALLKPKEVEAIAKAIGQGDVEGLKGAILGLSPRTVQAIAEALGYDNVVDLTAAINDLDPKTVEAVAKALGIDDVNGLKGAIDNVKDKDVEVNATTSGESKLTGLKSLIDGIKSKTVTITSWFKKITSGGSTRNDSNGYNDVNGTANVDGTTGRAFKQGNWGTKNSGTALVGELGTEILVRGGRYYTIGDNGAEFIKYQKGDIIFNHRQTEELFANGRITSGGGRGKAFVEGTAFSKGTGGFGKVISRVDESGTKKEEVKTTTKTSKKGKKYTVTNNTEINTGGGSSGTGEGVGSVGGNSVGTKQDKKEFEETFDWIETAISRIEREIDNLDRTANSTYKSWSERNKALASEISKVSEEIKLQNDAASEYLKEANSVGLDESWALKVREGTLDISTLNEKNSSEELIEKIKNYQKWYELYLDCTDAAEELREEESKLYAQRFENVQTQYDGILQGYEHTESMLNEYISQAEAKGHIVSKEYYNALIANEKKNINTLKHEQAELIAERDKAVAEGKITKGSEAWYEQCEAIDSVTQAIEEGTTALIEYSNSIRDIEWEVFDLIQEQISDITAEADFLIELMSNKDLFDDNGKFTAQGVATTALHAQNYNTYMYQADEYGKEAAELDKQIAKDPYDQELINRRRELIELQREMILNAEGEKNAIKDLVEEGIDLELSALDDLITKYENALDSQKD